MVSGDEPMRTVSSSVEIEHVGGGIDIALGAVQGRGGRERGWQRELLRDDGLDDFTVANVLLDLLDPLDDTFPPRSRDQAAGERRRLAGGGCASSCVPGLYPRAVGFFETASHGIGTLLQNRRSHDLKGVTDVVEDEQGVRDKEASQWHLGG
jgi:hypothetical protein